MVSSLLLFPRVADLVAVSLSVVEGGKRVRPGDRSQMVRYLLRSQQLLLLSLAGFAALGPFTVDASTSQYAVEVRSSGGDVFGTAAAVSPKGKLYYTGTWVGNTASKLYFGTSESYGLTFQGSTMASYLAAVDAEYGSEGASLTIGDSNYAGKHRNLR